MSYHGWTNHSTWLVSIWFGDMLSDMAADDNVVEDADQLRDYIMEMIEEDIPTSGIVSDFVYGALQSINWQELCDHYFPQEDLIEESDDSYNDAYALASAGMGTDEDYGYFGD